MNSQNADKTIPPALRQHAGAHPSAFHYRVMIEVVAVVQAGLASGGG